LWVRQGTYLRVEQLKRASLGYASTMSTKQYNKIERLARDTRSSLLQKLINYDCKKFIPLSLAV
jgi:hypothetical protein